MLRTDWFEFNNTLFVILADGGIWKYDGEKFVPVPFVQEANKPDASN
jgi:hypothetical protein